MSATTWAGVKVCPAYIKGGKMILTGISLALDNLSLPSQDIEVFIYSNLDLSTPLGSTIVTLSQNNKYFSATFATPVVLDLGNKDDDLEFYVVYEKTAGLRYVNNEVEEGCGCGGNASRIRKNPFLRFVDLSGIEATNVQNLDISPITSDSKMRGLRLDGYTSCDYFAWLCNLTFNAQDLVSNIGGGFDVNLGLQLAEIIRTRAAFRAGQKLLTSSNVNAVTLLAGEVLNELLAKWEADYDKYLKSFVYHVPDYVNDCFMCKIDKNISINSIIV
jgi:hypothetical protein